MKLTIVPIFQDEAKAFVEQHHRHHKAPVGSIFQIACALDGKIVGVVIVGRPVARHLQDGYTAEVTRLCTDGTKNACSKLYSAAWRVAKNLGYKKLVTYILESETGVSLKASGWKEIGKAGGLSWNVPSRPRVDKSPKQYKIRFEKEIN
ncbi:MAG: XF1762 family protein [Thermonemataceae bacterium]